MNETPDEQGLGPASSQMTCVKLSTGVKSPAWPFSGSSLNRAVILTDALRRDREAELELRKALELNPNYEPALFNLGNLSEDLGRREEAVKWYGRLLEVSPKNFEGLARFAGVARVEARDDALIAHDQHGAHAVLNHLLQCIVNLAILADSDRILAGKIGDGVKGRVARLEELTVGHRTARQNALAESPGRHQPCVPHEWLDLGVSGRFPQSGK